MMKAITIEKCVQLAAGVSAALLLTVIALVLSPAGPAEAAPPPGAPFGNFEAATGVPTGVQVKGWVIDPDTPDPIYVWVAVDGVGRHVYANGSRSDVGGRFPTYGDAHGFSATVPANAGTHQVCVTASNVGRGAHQVLGCRTVTVPNRSPYGTLEGLEPNLLEGFTVKGWMADPDDPKGPNFLWVTVDGVGRHIATGEARLDVQRAFPGTGPTTGFNGWFDTTPGPHHVCVTAVNVGPGSHTSLGCVTALVPSGSPFGAVEFLDVVRTGFVWGVYARGWAAEPSSPTDHFAVNIVVNGDVWNQTLSASQERPDIAAAYPPYGPYHGFDGIVAPTHPDMPLRPGQNRVCVVAPNKWGAGSDTTLGCGNVTAPAS